MSETSEGLSDEIVATDAVEHRVDNAVTPPKDKAVARKENDSQRTEFKLNLYVTILRMNLMRAKV